MANFSLSDLRELLRHMEWADATVWRAIRAHPPAAHDARLRALLMHLHAVQRAFLKIWTSQAEAFPMLDGTPDIEAVQEWVTSYYLELKSALDTFDDATLTRRYLATLEARIRERPHLWLWLHRRWLKPGAAA